MSVYLITAREIGRIKIGHAADVQRRMWDHQTSSPCQLQLEGLLPGGRREERELHERFSADRIRGEWFALSPQIEALIAASKTGSAEPPAATVKPSKARAHLEEEPWFSSRELRRRDQYAEARAKQQSLNLDPPRRAAA